MNLKTINVINGIDDEIDTLTGLPRDAEIAEASAPEQDIATKFITMIEQEVLRFTRNVKEVIDFRQ